MSERIPVVIDLDGGADGLWGLAVAAAHGDRMELKAVTVCGGRQGAAQAFSNSASYGALLKLSCPLYRGSERSVLLKERSQWKGDGPDGKLGMSLPEPLAYGEGYAWDAIYREAVAAEGELQVVCFGPMTNLAIALFKYEELAPLIKRVIFVGGSYDYGNISAAAEVNMATDPEAARAVFRSGIPKTMVGFNAIRESALSDEQIRRVMGERLSGELFLQCAAGREKLLSRVCFGAPLGMAALLEGDLLSWVRYHLTIETKSSLCRGRTTPLNMYSPRGFEKDTDIAMGVDMERYVEFLKAAVERMDVKDITWI
ncbi:MAG: nucleoside hydrolase [Lachnospiraceae bacterium]|nr:nucleoside hydrolase [Lachnospiraceae bacterium]